MTDELSPASLFQRVDEKLDRLITSAGQHDAAISEVKQRLHNVAEAIWGNGEPGLRARQDAVEKSVEDCQSRCATSRAAQVERIRWWVKLAVSIAVGLGAAAVGSLVTWFLAR
jgi:hypothetical protein